MPSKFGRAAYRLSRARVSREMRREINVLVVNAGNGYPVLGDFSPRKSRWFESHRGRFFIRFFQQIIIK